MLSNIALIVYYVALNKLNTGASNVTLNVWINAVTWFIYWALQNVSHWMFSFEYYNMVRVIPFVLEDIPLPENMVKSNRAQFWFWLILNVLVAFFMELLATLLMWRITSTLIMKQA